MDLRQTGEYAKFLSSTGWRVESKDGAKAYVKKFPLTFLSLVKIQRPKFLDFDWIESLVEKYKPIQVNVEPKDDDYLMELSKKGYKRQKVPFIPSRTILIDLSYSEKILLSMMKGKTRYNVGLAKRRGVEIKVVDGLKLIENTELFDKVILMQKQNAKRLGLFCQSKQWFENQVKAFGKNCFVVTAYFKNKLVAVAFYMISETGSFYSHNGSSSLGRKKHAPNLCLWEGMTESKKRGCEYLDLEGIYDPRSKILKWRGFTKFKKGFGGTELFYPGLYSKWFI